MFGQHLDVEPKEENKAFLTFVIPHDRESLLKVRIFNIVFCFHFFWSCPLQVYKSLIGLHSRAWIWIHMWTELHFHWCISKNFNLHILHSLKWCTSIRHRIMISSQVHNPIYCILWNDTQSIGERLHQLCLQWAWHRSMK